MRSLRILCLGLCMGGGLALPASVLIQAAPSDGTEFYESVAPSGAPKKEGVIGSLTTGLDQAASGYKVSGKESGNLTVIVGRVINAAMSLLGVVLLGFMIYAGFKWMTAEKPEDVQKAKDTIKNVIIGLVIIVAAYAISKYVLDALAAVLSGTS